mmetsp:Transcript_12941/g.48388  ORF Transcript_12941/g.48388 Transcript_12941/m.48388 type:complete len:204 (-) Transcript_12941:190-801(-)
MKCAARRCAKAPSPAFHAWSRQSETASTKSSTSSSFTLVCRFFSRLFKGSNARYTADALALTLAGAASENATSDHILISSRGVTMPTRGAVAGSTAPETDGTPPVNRKWFPRPASSSATRLTSLASTPRPSFPSLIIGPYTRFSWLYSALMGECDMEDTATFAGMSPSVSAPALSLVSTTWHDDPVSKETTLDDTRRLPETVA